MGRVPKRIHPDTCAWFVLCIQRPKLTKYSHIDYGCLFPIRCVGSSPVQELEYDVRAVEDQYMIAEGIEVEDVACRSLQWDCEAIDRGYTYHIAQKGLDRQSIACRLGY